MCIRDRLYSELLHKDLINLLYVEVRNMNYGHLELRIEELLQEMCIRDSLYTPPVTPWESVTPEVSDPTVRRELPKAGPITGVKS